MIKLENVTKSYQMGQSTYEALKGISIEIKKQELLSILGPSGSGKTTTMDILGLLDKPTSGKYYLDDIDTSEYSGDKLAALRNLRLGFIFQLYFLLPRLTSLQNVMLPLTYRHNENISQSEMELRAKKMLDEVGMGKHVNHKPMELSGGQQQRVAIARALIGNPSIILADEPTGALDSKTSQDIMNLLKDQVHKTGTTDVIVTQSEEMANQCERQIHIRDGLIFTNSKEDKII
jgi:putative ABC transport system ATP-binding protein